MEEVIVIKPSITYGRHAVCQAAPARGPGFFEMKCYTLSDKIVAGIPLEGLPTDSSLSGKSSATSVKVKFLFRDRDGFQPEELLDEDVGRASACARVVLSKSSKRPDGRFVVLYDPREWFLDRSSGSDGNIVYRSRKWFMAVSTGPSFRMGKLDGSKALSVEKGEPVVSDTGKPVPSLPDPGDGWFMATME